MKLTVSTPSLALLLATSIALTGCGSSFDPMDSEPSTSAIPALQGAVYGGQQPVAEAHVYLFATGTGGPGGNGLAAGSTNASKSLLNSSGNTSFDGTNYYVVTGANGSFSINGDYSCTAGSQVYLYSIGGNPGAGTNTAAGFLAGIGSCPAAGNFAATVSKVSINEISTVVTAYSLAGFATDATHISTTGSPLAATGIFNAMANVANLSDVANGVAYTATHAQNSTGVVPQALIYTVANILATCVNSSSSTSTACSTLFNDDRSGGGQTGTKPTDTATAAIYLAQHPYSPYVVTLFNLVGPNTPYGSALTSAPADYSLGITYTGSLDSAQDVAIDGSGNAWVTSFNPSSQANSSVTRFSPLGVPTVITSGGLNLPIGIAIDANGYAWAANIDSVTKISPAGVGTNYPIADPNGAWYIAVDGSDNIWVSTYTDTVLYELSESNGANVSGSPYSFPNSAQPEQLAIDSSNRVWAAYGNEGGLLELSNPGAHPTYNVYLQTSNPDVRANSGIAIDSTNGIWAVTDADTPSTNNGGEGIGKYNTSGASTLSVTNGSLYGDPVAIDGAGNVWIGQGQNAGGTGAVEYTNGGTLVSQAGGFTGGSQNLPLGIAIDGSGNVWLSNSGTDTNGTVVELIGSAAPVVTPISPFYPGKTTNGLGIRP